jgi:O-antigen ligase
MKPEPGVDFTLGTIAATCFVLLTVSLPGSIAPMSISAALCAVATVSWWVFCRVRPEGSPVLWPGIAWLFALVLSSAFALDPAGSWPRVAKGLFPALVPLAAFHAGNRKWGARALALLLISTAIAASYGVAAFVARGASFASRARGFSGHYMTFGGQLLLLVSLALGIALVVRSPRWRWGAAIAGAIASIALAATYTRSAWLGLAASSFVIVGLAKRRWLPALVVAIALLYAIAPAGIRLRLGSSFEPRHPNNLERTLMWQAGWRMFQERPWTGVGLEDLRGLYPTFRSPEAHETPGHLHSDVVQIAATMGIVGLAAFALLYGSLFVAAGAGLSTVRARDPLAAGLKIGVIGGLVGFLVAGAFEWNFGDEELLYLLYVLVGLAWGARRWTIASRSSASPSRPARASAPVESQAEESPSLA